MIHDRLVNALRGTERPGVLVTTHQWQKCQLLLIRWWPGRCGTFFESLKISKKSKEIPEDTSSEISRFLVQHIQTNAFPDWKAMILLKLLIIPLADDDSEYVKSSALVVLFNERPSCTCALTYADTEPIAGEVPWPWMVYGLTSIA